MLEWIFYGNFYSVKEDIEITNQFYKKLEIIGLNNEEMYKIMNMKPINFSPNIEEECDIICTESPSKIYITGFYYFYPKNKKKEISHIVIDGFFTLAHLMMDHPD